MTIKPKVSTNKAIIPRQQQTKATPVHAFDDPEKPRNLVTKSRSKSDMNFVESKVYGKNAVKALFDSAPDSLIRVYLDPSLVSEFGILLKYCAKSKKTYHLVEKAVLEKVSGTEHHEGICVLRRHKPLEELSHYLLKLSTSGAKGHSLPQRILCLEGVVNPHNLGALLRSAAHFGFLHVAASENSTKLGSAEAAEFSKNGKDLFFNGAVARSACGALEKIDVFKMSSPLKLISKLHALNYTTVATSSHAGALNLYTTNLSRPIVVFLGAEGNGLSEEVLQSCHLKVFIPGTGLVESLNVSNAGACLFAEAFRQSIHNSQF